MATRTNVQVEELLQEAVGGKHADIDSLANALGIKVSTTKLRLNELKKSFPDLFLNVENDLAKYFRPRTKLTQENILAILAKSKNMSVEDYERATDAKINEMADKKGVNPSVVLHDLQESGQKTREKKKVAAAKAASSSGKKGKPGRPKKQIA